MKITSTKDTLSSKTIIQNRKSNKSLHDKQKLKQYMTTKTTLQKILHRILHTKNENNPNHESTKPQEKKRQESRE
jgi:hypothetical protein